MESTFKQTKKGKFFLFPPGYCESFAIEQQLGILTQLSSLQSGQSGGGGGGGAVKWSRAHLARDGMFY